MEAPITENVARLVARAPGVDHLCETRRHYGTYAGC
jgi:hypothetical protein